MVRALGLPFRLDVVAFVVTQFGLLLGIPPLASALAQWSLLGEIFFFALWWLVGVVAFASKWMAESYPERALPRDWLRPVETNFRRALVGLPYASLLIHIGSLHWAYDAPFHLAYLAPVALGLGVTLSSMAEAGLSPMQRLTLRWIAPLVAVAASLSVPAELVFPLEAGGLFSVMVSPLRSALVAAAFVYAASFVEYRLRGFVAAATATSIAALSGYSVATIAQTTATAWRVLLPQTAVGWCVASIGAAFVFLVLGAAVSLSATPPRRRQPALPRRV